MFNWFFVQSILADIHRRELSVVSLESSSGVEYKIYIF